MEGKQLEKKPQKSRENFWKDAFRRGILFLVTLSLVLGSPGLPQGIFGEGGATLSAHGGTGTRLSTETYHHLDMGVQLVYFNGTVWEEGYEYGGNDQRDIQTSIHFSQDILVKEVYPLESSKGASRYDFDRSTSSHNIPPSLGGSREAYESYYKDYVSTGLRVSSFGGSGREARFDYAATLNSPFPLEVFEYGEMGRGAYIYSLFGGEAKLKSQQPEIHASVKDALQLGAAGAAGNKKLYLVFCPNVVEYQKYVPIAEVMADLSLPSTAKQGETYQVEDISLIDDALLVESAVLEKRRESSQGEWIPVATWPGTLPGENTGGMAEESESAIGNLTYRLTVTTSDGQVDTAEKTIAITDGRVMEGEAKLNLQPVTYEGHPAWAVDESSFTVDGEKYSALRGYEEGIGDNAFRPQSSAQARVTRKSPVEAELVFPKRGNYEVDLQIDLADGQNLKDTKPIEVKKTPFILDNLGGFQKQNRRQVLTATVATAPGAPITDYYMELTDLKTLETVRMTPANPQQNGVNLKTRSLQQTGGMTSENPQDHNPLWTTFTLEFLTKTPVFKPVYQGETQGDQSQSFRYTIWVKDQKGEVDLVEKTFRVVPDMPPLPEIGMQETFLREKDTNAANLEAHDQTVTDGDQVERIWTVDGAPVQGLPGFRDFSYQAMQHIGFQKEGVGPVEVKLSVTDKWVEPTLPEYVTEEERLTGSVSRRAEVVNIAPVVSLKPVEAKEAKVYILATPEQVPYFRDRTNQMKAALLEKGIYSTVQVIPRSPEDQGGYRSILNKSWTSAMWCPSTCREIGPIYDSGYVYTIRSNSIVSQNYSQVCNGTHTIYADSVDGTLTGWRYTVNQANSYYLRLDNREKYVYVVSRDSEKTILLDRQTGAEVSVLPITMDGEIFLSEEGDIFVGNANSIRKYSKTSGKLEKVSEGGALMQEVEGTISFVGRDPGTKKGNRFFLGQYDMETGTLSGRALPEIPADELVWTAGGKSAITPTDMDLAGKVVFVQTYSNSNHRTGQNATVWVVDSRTQKILRGAMIAPMGSEIYYLTAFTAGFVRDSRGEGKYLYANYYENENRTTTRVKWLLKLFDLEGDTGGELLPVYSTYRQQNNYNFSNLTYAKLHEAENKIYLLRGNAFQGYDWGGFQAGERMVLHLPDFVRGPAVSQWDVAEEYATDKGFLSATYYFYEQWMNPENRVKIYRNTITKDQAVDFAVSRQVKSKEEGNTFLLTSLEPEEEALERATLEIEEAMKENSRWEKALSLEKLQGVWNGVKLKRGSLYEFEYDIRTSGGAITKVFYPMQYGAPAAPTFQHYKEIAAQLDFNNPESVQGNSFYTCSSTGYLDGRGGYGSGYYGKKGQSKTYSFTVKQTMAKAGYVDFDFFSYHGYQAYGEWSITVDGKLYDAGRGGADAHKTLFLPEGTHEIRFTGWITSGYYGYIGISEIQTVYYMDPPQDNSTENVPESQGWNEGKGSFSLPPEPLFNRSLEIKNTVQKETFAGNYPHLSQYLRFPCYEEYPWRYSGAQASATMSSGYQVAATGSFGVEAPYNRHLVVTFEEDVYIPRSATTTSLSGGSKMIGANTYLVEAGHSFYRNYYLQRGRSGGYGSVRVSGIRIFEISSSIPVSAIFGEEGAAALDLEKRTATFYTLLLTGADKTSCRWEAYTGLDLARQSQPEAITLIPQGTAPGDQVLLRHFRLYEKILGAKMLLVEEKFRQAEEALQRGWQPLPPLGTLPVVQLEKTEEPEPDLIYKKGEVVAHRILYSDYEKDPSKKSYWRYTHTPFNDGPHPQSGQVLHEPIWKFYIDGKYTVEHWQEDNTARKDYPKDAGGFPVGNPDYDKLSNVESLTFYIEGTAEAPWIVSIHTGQAGPQEAGGGFAFLRKKVEQGMNFGLQIRVDDLEKEVLSLETELYKDGKMILQHFQDEIMPANQVYPPVTIPAAGRGEAGTYQVVCTVRDETGAGLGTYKFQVVVANALEGWVNHTEAWEENRRKFNLEHPVVGDPETPRGKSVFWPGETFVLKAEAGGNPSLVTCEILGVNRENGEPRYKTSLSATGMKNSRGENMYGGTLWHPDMLKEWRGNILQPLTFRFTSVYPEVVLTKDVQVVLDNREPFLLLHRVW